MSGFDPRGFAPANIDWSIVLADRILYWQAYLAMNHKAMATIDFETRSPVSIKSHGSWKYSRDPRTQAMCLAVLLPGEADTLWHAGYEDLFISETPPPTDLFAFILAGGLVEAHNAFFERVIWTNIMHKRHGWPAVPPAQWRCSAAKCSAVALPRALGDACMAMGLPVDMQKDKIGRAVMLKVSKPRKPRKSERDEWAELHGKTPMPLLYHETEEDMQRLWSYCLQDTRSERALSDVVPDLSPYELIVWQMDQTMNWRGARFDTGLARAALKMADRYKLRLNTELEVITGISSATQRAKVVEWLIEHENLSLPDTTKDTLDWYVRKVEMSGRALRIIEIMKEVNRSSTRKYTAILNYADDEDERIRDLLMYHGAGTGRWAGKGVQVQNFPKGEYDDLDMDEACQWILDGDLDWIEVMYGDVMSFLSATLRGTMIPEDGRDFMVADYSAIEARCVLWLADAQTALDVFRRGEDIYCDMATGIYGRKITKKDKQERQFGKQAVLGLGYGMGFITFLLTCRKYKITFSRQMVAGIMGYERLEHHENWIRDYLRLAGHTPMPDNLDDKDRRTWINQGRVGAMARRRIEDARENPAHILHELALMRYTVQIYRARYPQVKDMWTAQEGAAIQAVKTGKEVVCGKVTWFMTTDKKFLHCRLPSGRLLSYVDPTLKVGATPWGERRAQLRYMRMGALNIWESTSTYGGKFVENITQAVARDIMASAMVDAYTEGPYETIASIHDELICEVDKGEGDIEDFEHLMGDIPPWAYGCPITAEAKRFHRYRK